MRACSAEDARAVRASIPERKFEERRSKETGHWKLADSLKQHAKLKKGKEKEGEERAKIERVLRWECLMADALPIALSAKCVDRLSRSFLAHRFNTLRVTHSGRLSVPAVVLRLCRSRHTAAPLLFFILVLPGRPIASSTRRPARFFERKKNETERKKRKRDEEKERKVEREREREGGSDTVR